MGLGSVRFLMSVGDLVLGWLLQQQAAVAIDGARRRRHRCRQAPSTRARSRSASFFAKNFLPLLTSTRSVIDNLDNEVMELDEAAF